MKIETADIWNKVVNKVMKNKKVTREQAEEIVNAKEVWLIDMVEAFGEKKVSFLADCITDEN
jgi:hypothetical protein